MTNAQWFLLVGGLLLAAFAYYLLGLPLGAGALLGAILAPTDPVLATDVQIRYPGDPTSFALP